MDGEPVIRELKVLGAMLERFNSVESLLASIITLHIRPDGARKEFLQSRLLHSSIVSYASKVKLVLAISQAVGGPKLDRNKFHEFGNIRNAFAHGRIQTGKRRSAEGDSSNGDEYYIVESIKGDGSVQEMRRSVAVSKSSAIYEEIKPKLRELEEIVRRAAA